MTVLSGTLADLDLASIARVTSLGRTSLRLELRAPSGALIGKLVLKAGRVVSATAGHAHGHDALRVLMSAASDTRFELAHEPLDFALASALISVAELGTLRRTPLGSTRQPASTGAPRPARAAIRSGPTPQAAVRIAVMQGRLDEFDLLTLLQTFGMSRQLIAIDVRDGAGATLGTVSVKAGKIVSARAGDTAGVDAIPLLLRSPRSLQFAAFRVAGDFGPLPALASVAEVSLRLAAGPAPRAAAAPASLSSAALEPAAVEPATREPTATPLLRPVTAPPLAASDLAGHEPTAHEPTAHEPVAPPLPHTATAPSLAPDGRAGPGAPALVMEGKLSDFDIRTLLETLGATRQHVRVQVFDSEQGPLGEVALKAGWILSSQVGALVGVDALVVLLGVSRQLRFRVLAAPAMAHAALQPLGAIAELLARLAIDRAPPPPEPTTRILRWAIPVSFLVGGAIVFVVLHGWTAHPAQHAPAAAMKIQPGGEASTAIAAPPPATAVETSPPSAQPSAPPPSPSAQPSAAPPSPSTHPSAAPPSPSTQPSAAPPPSSPPPLIARSSSSAPPSAATSSPSAPPSAPSPAPLAPPPAATLRPAAAPPPPSPPPPVAAPSSSPPSSVATPSSLEQPSAPPPSPSAQRSAVPPPPSAQPSPARIGASVRAAQTALQHLGYDPGPVDNVYGRLTRDAVLQFQRAQHLAITGVLDQQTWSAIITQLSQ